MTDTFDWKSLIAPAGLVLTAVLPQLLPRVWPDNLRRLQSQTETRVKRLEALEKALSVATTAKTTLGIEIPTHDLQNELQQIVHEFARPVVLSRDALEEWSTQSLSSRLNVSPNFTVPADKAAFVRRAKYSLWLCIVLVFIPFVIPIMDGFNFGTSARIFLKSLGITSDTWIIFVFYGMVLYLLIIFLRFRSTKQALRIIRAMPEGKTTEKTGPVPAEPPLQDFAS